MNFVVCQQQARILLELCLPVQSFLNILLFRQPQLVYFGSHDEGQGCSDLSDLTRFLPGKVPPKKGKLLILAYKEAEKYY